MKKEFCDSCKQGSLTFVLDCGFRVCEQHFENVNNGPKVYSCEFCKKTHKYDDCEKSIANKIALTEFKLEKTIGEVENRINVFNKIKQQKDYFRGKYYLDVRKKVETKKEELLNNFELELNKYFKRVIDNLNSINSYNEEKIKKNTTFNQLDDIKANCDGIMDEKESVNLSEKLDYLERSNQFVNQYLSDLESLKKELDIMKSLEFIENKQLKNFEFKQCFGKFKLGNEYFSETGESDLFKKVINKENIKKNKNVLQLNKETLKDLKLNQILDGHSGKITVLGDLSNGDLVTGSADGLVKIWNLNDGSLKKVLPGEGTKIKCFKILPNDTIAVCSDLKRSYSSLGHLNCEMRYSKIRIFDPITGSIEKTIQSPSTISSIESLNNDYLITGHDDGSIYFCNKQTGEYWPKMSKTLHYSTVYSLIMLNKDNLISTSADYTIKIWDLNDKKLIRNFTECNGLNECLKRLNDNQFLTGSQNGSIKLWDIRESNIIKTFESSRREVKDLKILDDDKFLSCSDDGLVVLWSIKEGKIFEKKIENNLSTLKSFNNVYFDNKNQIITTYNDKIFIFSLNKD